MKRAILTILAFVVGAALAVSAVADQQAGEMTLDPKEAAEHFQTRGYSPYADRGFPTRPMWGDTHLHTANSPDAFAFGNRLGPEEAYKFARGETVTLVTGQRAQLSRPLDFLVVADHGVAIGAALRRVSLPWPAWAWLLPAYAIGALAAFWTIERVAGFWS